MSCYELCIVIVSTTVVEYIAMEKGVKEVFGFLGPLDDLGFTNDCVDL